MISPLSSKIHLNFSGGILQQTAELKLFQLKAYFPCSKLTIEILQQGVKHV